MEPDSRLKNSSNTSDVSLKSFHHGSEKLQYLRNSRCWFKLGNEIIFQGRIPSVYDCRNMVLQRSNSLPHVPSNVLQSLKTWRRNNYNYRVANREKKITLSWSQRARAEPFGRVVTPPEGGKSQKTLAPSARFIRRQPPQQVQAVRNTRTGTKKKPKYPELGTSLIWETETLIFWENLLRLPTLSRTFTLHDIALVHNTVQT